MKMISQGTTVRIARGSTFGMLRDTLNLGRDKVLAEYNGELFGMGREIPDAGEVSGGPSILNMDSRRIRERWFCFWPMPFTGCIIKGWGWK